MSKAVALRLDQIGVGMAPAALAAEAPGGKDQIAQTARFNRRFGFLHRLGVAVV